MKSIFQTIFNIALFIGLIYLVIVIATGIFKILLFILSVAVAIYILSLFSPVKKLFQYLWFKFVIKNSNHAKVIDITEDTKKEDKS